MRNEIKCPNCNTNLNGRDKIYRSLIIEDSQWFGIVNGEIINCDITPSQPTYGDLCCINCGESVQEYIEGIIEEGAIEQGDLY